MNVIYFLIFISFILFFFIVYFLFWSVKNKQFDNLENQSKNIIYHDIKDYKDI